VAAASGLRGDDSDAAGQPNEFGDRAARIFSMTRAAMDLDGLLSDTELRGDLLLEHSRHDEGKTRLSRGVSSFDEHAVLSALRRAAVPDCPSRKAVDD